MFSKIHWLDEITTGTDTDPEALEGVFRFGIEIEVTGSPSAPSGIHLQGSLTGEHWRDILSPSVTDGVFYSAPGAVSLVRFIRLSVPELSSGTITASVVAYPMDSIQDDWSA